MTLERKDYIIKTALNKVMTIFNVKTVRNCRINHQRNYSMNNATAVLFFNYETPQSDLLMESHLVFGDYWFYNNDWLKLSNKTEDSPDAEVNKLVPYNFSKDETQQAIARIAARIYNAFKYRGIIK